MHSTVDGSAHTNDPGSQIGRRARAGWRYRYPVEYRVAWGALVLLIVLDLIIAPQAFNANSVRLMSGLAAVLVVASLGQVLVIIIGASTCRSRR